MWIQRDILANIWKRGLCVKGAFNVKTVHTLAIRGVMMIIYEHTVGHG